MKIFLTGSEGYIGSVTAPLLLLAGHGITRFDSGFFAGGDLFPPELPADDVVHGDTRRLTPEDLQGYDAVVHMAELSNDPMGQINPEVTHAINYHGSVRLARTAKAAGVSRFVHMSSCSVYGIAVDDVVDESSALNPQTVYARCKRLVEEDVSKLADDSFCPTFLRNATACGVSPRQRFDLVVNNLCGLAWTRGEIAMTSDGSPWRPIVHVRDIVQAILCVLDAPADTVRNEILNVGATDQNFRIRQLAEIVHEVFPDCNITLGDRGGDTRSYRVAFEKIRRVLPMFKCRWPMQRTVQELHDVFKQVGLTAEMFASPKFTRMKQIENLIDTGRIDSEFFWTEQPQTEWT